MLCYNKLKKILGYIFDLLMLLNYLKISAKWHMTL
jgi:hypothetical protein